MELVNYVNRFVPSIENDKSKYVNAGSKLLAHQITYYKYSLTSHGDVDRWIYKEEHVLVEFLTWTKYLVHMSWQRFYPNMVLILKSDL